MQHYNILEIILSVVDYLIFIYCMSYLLGKEQKDRHRYITVSYASFPCAAIIGGNNN